jgi:hypothetical protein
MTTSSFSLNLHVIFQYMIRCQYLMLAGEYQVLPLAQKAPCLAISFISCEYISCVHVPYDWMFWEMLQIHFGAVLYMSKYACTIQCKYNVQVVNWHLVKTHWLIHTYINIHMFSVPTYTYMYMYRNMLQSSRLAKSEVQCIVQFV